MAKSSFILITLAISASAFVQPPRDGGSKHYFRSTESVDEIEDIVEIMEERVGNIKDPLFPPATLPDDVFMSTALPFLERPNILKGQYAGDNGFDPLGFATCEGRLSYYREAEIKHARLAMLAAAGWPLSEILDRQIANALGMTPLLDTTDRAPILFTGGASSVSDKFWFGVLGLSALVELQGFFRRIARDPEYFPGHLDFDPLGLYPDTYGERREMQLAEIKHGRIAMMAVLFYGIQETLTGKGIIDGF